MSQNIQLNPPRVPIGTLDTQSGRVTITPEWYRWMTDVFARVGGVEGFSNQEIYSDAATQQSHDEMLQRVGSVEAMQRGQFGEATLEDLLNRISALEASNRELSQAVQYLATDQMMSAGQLSAPEVSNLLDRLTVKGDTRLATESGNVLVGTLVASGPAALQVSGSAQATGYRVGANQVVGAREDGIAAYGAYGGQTVSATYAQGEAQQTDNAVRNASTKLAQIVTALRSHGLIGD